MRRRTKHGTIEHTRPIAMPEIDRKAMGMRIQVLRLHRRWTQRALARAIGMSEQSVSNWEGGFNVPSRDNLVRLSSALGRTMDYLLLGRRDRFKRKR